MLFSKKSKNVAFFICFCILILVVGFLCGVYYIHNMIGDASCVEYKSAIKKFERNGLNRGVVVFGSARIKNTDKHIKEIEEISELCAKRIRDTKKPISFITGGGPSVMEAWLKPAQKIGIQTSGMAIKLPYEDALTKYADERLSFTFREFSTRKKAMIKYARAIVVFKGGYGSMDELFETLTLINTGRINPIPIFVYPRDFYVDVLNFNKFLDAKTISISDGRLITFFDSKEELLKELYKIIDNS